MSLTRHFHGSRYYSPNTQFNTDTNNYLRDLQQALQSLTGATERCQLTYIGSAGDNVRSLGTREAARRTLILEAYRFLQTTQGPIDAATTCYEQVLSIDSSLSDAGTKPSWSDRPSCKFERCFRWGFLMIFPPTVPLERRENWRQGWELMSLYSVGFKSPFFLLVSPGLYNPLAIQRAS
jgi:hypothetical protein